MSLFIASVGAKKIAALLESVGAESYALTVALKFLLRLNPFFIGLSSILILFVTLLRAPILGIKDFCSSTTLLKKLPVNPT